MQPSWDWAPERGCYRMDGVELWSINHLPLEDSLTANRFFRHTSSKAEARLFEAVDMSSIPKNAHISTHPCLQAKLSQLRSASTGSRDAQTLVHEIALMVGYEALGAGLKAQEDGTVSVSP